MIASLVRQKQKKKNIKKNQSTVEIIAILIISLTVDLSVSSILKYLNNNSIKVNRTKKIADDSKSLMMIFLFIV